MAFITSSYVHVLPAAPVCHTSLCTLLSISPGFSHTVLEASRPQRGIHEIARADGVYSYAVLRQFQRRAGHNRGFSSVFILHLIRLHSVRHCAPISEPYVHSFRPIFLFFRCFRLSKRPAIAVFVTKAVKYPALRAAYTPCSLYSP